MTKLGMVLNIDDNPITMDQQKIPMETLLKSAMVMVQRVVVYFMGLLWQLTLGHVMGPMDHTSYKTVHRMRGCALWL